MYLRNCSKRRLCPFMCRLDDSEEYPGAQSKFLYCVWQASHILISRPPQMEDGKVATKAGESAGNIRQYAVQPILGKGQGLVATSRIRKGTRILSEAPILKVPRDTSDLQAVESVIVEQLKTLCRDQQRAFFALPNAHGKHYSPFLGIARTNVLPLGSRAREGGLFLEASRINHSCTHNAQNTWNAKIGCLTIHALRDIEEG